jgi:hypothetical protein
MMRMCLIAMLLVGLGALGAGCAARYSKREPRPAAREQDRAKKPGAVEDRDLGEGADREKLAPAK